MNAKCAVLILGGRSHIGLAVARRFAELGHPIQLAARNVTALQREQTDLAIRFDVEVSLFEFDVLHIEGHDDFVARLPVVPGVVVCVVGLLGSQEASERNVGQANLVIGTNYVGPASILGVFANSFAARGTGCIVGVSSVAGERGRASNYVYGSAKAGLTAFLSGLRCRLHGSGVDVITILPGFVATRMTEGMKLPLMLTASPAEVANAIASAVVTRKSVVYVRPVWRFIMGIIRIIPDIAFRKMRI